MSLSPTDWNTAFSASHKITGYKPPWPAPDSRYHSKWKPNSKEKKKNWNHNFSLLPYINEMIIGGALVTRRKTEEWDGWKDRPKIFWCHEATFLWRTGNHGAPGAKGGTAADFPGGSSWKMGWISKGLQLEELRWGWETVISMAAGDSHCPPGTGYPLVMLGQDTLAPPSWEEFP